MRKQAHGVEVSDYIVNSLQFQRITGDSIEEEEDTKSVIGDEGTEVAESGGNCNRN